MKPKTFTWIGIGLVTILVFLSGVFGGAVDTAKALWKFHQELPDVSMFILLDINQQEEQVPAYELPSVLRTVAGKPITSAGQWQNNRENLLSQFAGHIYGQTPDQTISVKSRVIESSELALNGKALRQQVELSFNGHKVTVLIYRPNNVSGPVPAFLGLNFRGNHTISEDPAVQLTQSWVPKDEDHGVLSYHLRAGKHDLLDFDWRYYLNFADCYLVDKAACQQ